jgi:hypothetical protein
VCSEGSNLEEEVWDPTSFAKNRDRLLEADVAKQFLTQAVEQAGAQGLTSDEHFTVDGTLVEAWARNGIGGMVLFPKFSEVDKERRMEGRSLTFWARSRVLVTGGSATKGGRAPKANPPHWNKIYARVTRRKGCLGLNKQVGTLYEGISA